MTKKLIVIALICLVFIGIALATFMFIQGEQRRIAQSRATFEPVDRALKSLQSAIMVGVTERDYGNKVQALALEIMLVKDKITSPEELQLHSAYETILEKYNDAFAVWRAYFKGNHDWSFYRSEGVLHDNDIPIPREVEQSIINKYGLPVITRLIPRIHRTIDVIDLPDSLRQMWRDADEYMPILKGRQVVVFSPRWQQWRASQWRSATLPIVWIYNISVAAIVLVVLMFLLVRYRRKGNKKLIGTSASPPAEPVEGAVQHHTAASGEQSK